MSHSFPLRNMDADKQRNSRSKGLSHQPVKHFSTDVDAQIETTKRVLELVNESGLSITQVNGQRKLGPPPNWIGPPPSPKCEVFVGKLPRDVDESEIYPIFRRIGEIYEIRLMMDFSGTNRGYCFVMYTNARDAQRAIQDLNSYEIRNGRRIGVLASVNNCRLCVSHLPRLFNTEAFIKKIFETTSGVEKVSVYRLPDERPKNALIFYKTHIDAAMARRRLVPERSNFIHGAEITVDWAHPNLSPENVVEEYGIVDKDGKVKVCRRFIEFGKKNYTRDGRFFKEKIQLSGINDNETISPELEESSRINMSRKKLNLRQKSCHFFRLSNSANEEQQNGSSLNQRIVQHYSNNSLSCKNHQFIENIKTQDINGNVNNYMCPNKVATTCEKMYQSASAQITWMPLLFNADNFFCSPNDFHHLISRDVQINYVGNNPRKETCENNAVRQVMQNIQTNWPLNQESKRFNRIIETIPHNIQQVAYDDSIWEKRMIALTNNDFSKFKQPRPILNRLS